MYISNRRLHRHYHHDHDHHHRHNHHHISFIELGHMSIRSDLTYHELFKGLP